MIYYRVPGKDLLHSIDTMKDTSATILIFNEIRASIDLDNAQTDIAEKFAGFEIQNTKKRYVSDDLKAT